MFRVFGKRNVGPNSQIPYTLYEALQQSSPRRRRVRAVLEVVLVASLVIALAFGTAALYKHLNNKRVASNDTAKSAGQSTTDENSNAQKKSTQSKQPSSNTSSVNQAPQENKQAPTATSKPTVTSESHTTNSGTVSKPH